MHDSMLVSDSLEGADGVITKWRGEMLPLLCDHLAAARSLSLASADILLLLLYGASVASSGCDWPAQSERAATLYLAPQVNQILEPTYNHSATVVGAPSST